MSKMLKEMVTSTNSSLAVTSSSVSSFATTSKKTSKAGFSKLEKQISSIATHSRAESKAITLQIEVSWTFQIPVLMFFIFYLRHAWKMKMKTYSFNIGLSVVVMNVLFGSAFFDNHLSSVQSYDTEQYRGSGSRALLPGTIEGYNSLSSRWNQRRRWQEEIHSWQNGKLRFITWFLIRLN